MDLDASDEQLDFPILYGIARQGVAVRDPKEVADVLIGEGEKQDQKEPAGLRRSGSDSAVRYYHRALPAVSGSQRGTAAAAGFDAGL